MVFLPSVNVFAHVRASREVLSFCSFPSWLAGLDMLVQMFQLPCSVGRMAMEWKLGDPTGRNRKGL